jgi:serine/threonine protein kinase
VGRFGDYTLVEKIGQGGMAEIWLAKRGGVRGFEKPLALKKILLEHTVKKAFVEMLIDEAKLTSRLTHQNIVQIYELGAIDGEYFIAMEYVPGWDLLRVLQRAASRKRPIPAGVAIRILADACRGLDYAHSARGDRGEPLRIVHFDCSPSNILVGVTGAVKVSDFGVARAAMDTGEGTASDRFRGKIAYMSPEQLDNRAVDHRSDIFSAGICLYETLTLKRLFRANSDAETMEAVRQAAIEHRLERHPEIPTPVKEILRRALARDPADRFATAGDMASDLEGFLFDNRVRVTSREVADFLVDLFEGQPMPGHQLAGAPKASDPRPPSASPKPAASWRSMSGAGEALSEAQRAAPTEGGFIDADRVAPLLARMTLERQSGSLLLTRTPVRKELFFQKGQVVFGRSNLDDEQLAGIFVSEKIVDERRLMVAANQARERDLPIEAMAMSLGLIDTPALVRALNLQLERRLTELFRWRNGHYGWYANNAPPKDALRIDVDALGLLGRGIAAHMSTSSLGAYFTKLMNPEVSRAASAPFPLERLRLTPRELRFANLVAARPIRVRDLLRSHCKSDDDIETALRVTFLLYQTGHILADGVSYMSREATGT